jgi:hypothetical protein
LAQIASARGEKVFFAVVVVWPLLWVLPQLVASTAASATTRQTPLKRMTA